MGRAVLQSVSYFVLGSRKVKVNSASEKGCSLKEYTCHDDLLGSWFVVEAGVPGEMCDEP